MAKRLITNGGAATAGPRPGVESCRICGGPIIVETVPGRPASTPSRKLCRRCGAEYGTTRPAVVRY